MALRKLFYTLPPNLRFIARKLFYFPSDTLNSILGKRHKYEPAKGDIYTGSGDFIKQGKHQLALLKEHINIQPNHHVLDIGCGIGRTAVALTEFLNSSGSYAGFDAVDKGINWCKQTIGHDFPNFEFTYVPLQNDLYNKSVIDAKKFNFPYPAEQFEVAFLFSVFTHMGIEEIKNYLKEISRTLKSDGKCLATFFIYNPEIEAELDERQDFKFHIKRDGYRLMDANVTAANIAISQVLLEEMALEAHLTIDKEVKGFWKDKNLKQKGHDFQDVVVFSKA
jgi:ubiquinone/menaquinone biosynthesis C-methylase UbiE